MGAANYRRSAARERELEKLLRDHGWFARRTPASKGGADVIAIKAGIIRLYEVKCTKTPYSHFPPADREELKRLARICGGDAWLAWYPHRKPVRYIHEKGWPE